MAWQGVETVSERTVVREADLDTAIKELMDGSIPSVVRGRSLADMVSSLPPEMTTAMVDYVMSTVKGVERDNPLTPRAVSLMYVFVLSYGAIQEEIAEQIKRMMKHGPRKPGD